MMLSVRVFCTTVLFGLTVVAEPPAGSGFAGNDVGPSLKGIRYAGPIVYTNERPPVIHFPPPPQVSSSQDFTGITRGKSVKYVPMPTHDLPILIYTSDVSPPLHVVSPPGHNAQLKGGERMQGEYSNSAPSYSSKPGKSKSKSSLKASSGEKYRTVEAYPEKSSSKTRQSGRGGQSLYDRLQPLTQSIKNFIGQSQQSFKSLTSPSASPRPHKSKRKQSYSSDSMGEYSSKNEVVAKPRPTAKQASPLPHIIYTGHAPIHIFNQSPVYVPNSKSQSQHASPKTTHDYQEAESAPRPRYAPKNPTKEPQRQRGYKEASSSAFSKYKPSFYSGKEQQKYKMSSYGGNSRPTKSSSDFSYSSSQRKPYKALPVGSTKGPYSEGSHGQTKQSSYFSASTYPKNYVRSSAMAPKRKPSKSRQQEHYGKAPAKQYSPAPSALNKPPIIIYQGLYPPHHVYENTPSVDYRIGQASAPAPVQQEQVVSPQSTVNRMSTNEGGSMEARVDAEYGLGTQAAPTYYLPALEMSAPAMYVSDLTSQGTAAPQPQFYTMVPTQGAGLSGPQTHTIQIQNADGSHTTAQVTTLSTAADHGVQPHAEARLDSLPPAFLAAGLNNQNNPLVPMSISSIIVQSAGAQPHL